MTIRDQLACLSEEIEALLVEGNKLLQDAYGLEETRIEFYAKIIQEEGLLAGSWRVISNDPTLVLEAVGDWDDFPKLKDLLTPDYHDRFALWSSRVSYLDFNDGSVRLTFVYPSGDTAQFIKDHGIILDLDDMIQNRDDLGVKFEAATKLVADYRNITKTHYET